MPLQTKSNERPLKGTGKGVALRSLISQAETSKNSCTIHRIFGVGHQISSRWEPSGKEVTGTMGVGLLDWGKQSVLLKLQCSHSLPGVEQA